MAKILCRKGGKLSEHVLWSNSSPDANFSRQSVTLSDSIDDFDYIKFRYARSTGDTSTVGEVITTPAIIKECTIPSGSGNGNNIGLVAVNSGTKYCRIIGFQTVTSIEISAAYEMNGSGTPSTYAVPLEIIGMKY